MDPTEHTKLELWGGCGRGQGWEGSVASPSSQQPACPPVELLLRERQVGIECQWGKGGSSGALECELGCCLGEGCM